MNIFSNCYKRENSFAERLLETRRIMNKYQDRVPIICEKGKNAGKECPNIDKKKYLVPQNLTIGQFIYVIRQRLRLDSEKALFIFINGKIPTNTQTIIEIYEKEKDKDGFLYITYAQENTFGYRSKSGIE